MSAFVPSVFLVLLELVRTILGPPGSRCQSRMKGLGYPVIEYWVGPRKQWGMGQQVWILWRRKWGEEIWSGYLLVDCHPWANSTVTSPRNWPNMVPLPHLVAGSSLQEYGLRTETEKGSTVSILRSACICMLNILHLPCSFRISSFLPLVLKKESWKVSRLFTIICFCPFSFC